MFQDTKKGQTHFEGDNCGEPAHNPKDTNFLIKNFEQLHGKSATKDLKDILKMKKKEAYKIVIKDLKRDQHKCKYPSPFCAGCVAKRMAEDLQEFYSVFYDAKPL